MSDTTKQLARATIRVLIVDDHEIVRKGLCSMLSEEEDFVVVGQTGSGNLAVTLVMQLQPDIVLLDIFLDSCNGLDIAQQLQRGCPETRIVILTGHTEEGHLFRAMRIGVHGYLQKALPMLLRLAAQGCSNKEIAARQFWSEVTVKRKMQDIYHKLQVTDRVQAVAEAMRIGLI